MTNLTEQDRKDLLEKYPNINPDLIASQGTKPAPRITSLSSKFAKNKYNVASKENRTYNGKVYASRAEMRKAQELDLRIKAGEIDFYLEQVYFDLGGSPRVRYKADFLTFKHLRFDSIVFNDVTVSDAMKAIDSWEIHLIEVKGKKTKDFIIKEKLYREQYDLPMEITK